jgi:hypothetical protein
MKGANSGDDPNDMLPEYDFTGAVRGKYYQRYLHGVKFPPYASAEVVARIYRPRPGLFLMDHVNAYIAVELRSGSQPVTQLSKTIIRNWSAALGRITPGQIRDRIAYLARQRLITTVRGSRSRSVRLTRLGRALVDQAAGLLTMVSPDWFQSEGRAIYRSLAGIGSTG